MSLVVGTTQILTFFVNRTIAFVFAGISVSVFASIFVSAFASIFSLAFALVSALVRARYLKRVLGRALTSWIAFVQDATTFTLRY